VGCDIDANDFEVRAERLVGDASHVLYSFSIRSGARLLLEGRISVTLSAGSLTPTRCCGAAAALWEPHLPVRWKVCRSTRNPARNETDLKGVGR
jgi:hypothetical protein